MLESFVHISKIFTKMRKTCLFKVYWKHPLWVFAWAAAWQYWRCLQVSDWKWETWLNIFSFFGGMWSSVSLNSVNAQLKFLADISLLVPENDSNHSSSEQQNQRACQFWDSHNFLLNQHILGWWKTAQCHFSALWGLEGSLKGSPVVSSKRQRHLLNSQPLHLVVGGRF